MFSFLKGSLLSPFSFKGFRLIWLVWFSANILMWMTEVASAWVMLSITSSPVWVSLIQTASMAPILLFGLLTGALADRFDKRLIMVASQFWITLVAGLMFVIIFLGQVNKYNLLALMFFNGVGLAVRWPVFASIVPSLVSKSDLPAALALNGVSINLSRVIGPIVAGVVLAHLGASYLFLTVSIISLFAAVSLVSWRYASPVGFGRGEGMTKAIIAGIKIVFRNAEFRFVVVHLGIFFANAISVFCLLPLVAQSLGDGARFYAIILACSGLGAVVAAFFYPYLGRRFASRSLVYFGFMGQGGATIFLGYGENKSVGMTAMFFCGVAYLTTSNTLIVAAQGVLSDSIRARGMSIVQMTIMGCGAVGSVIWGNLAAWTSVAESLIFSGSVLLIIGAFLFLIDELRK